MGASIKLWLDRQPVTIIEVSTFKSGSRRGLPCSVVVQLDDYQQIQESDPAEYEFTPNPEAQKFTFIRNVNNIWVQRGRGGRSSILLIGQRQVRFDARVQSLVEMR